MQTINLTVTEGYTEVMNLSMLKGDTFSQPIVFYDSSDVIIDISGWIITFTVKKLEYLTSDDDTDAEISVSETIGASPAGVSGAWTLLITHAMTTTTKDVLSGIYKYDLQIVNGTTVITPLRGDFEIIQDVTKEIT